MYQIYVTVRQPKYIITPAEEPGYFWLKGPGSACKFWGLENAENAQRMAEENLGNGRFLGADKGG